MMISFKKLLIIPVLIAISATCFAQKKYVFVFLNNNPGKEELSQQQVDSLQKGHMANISRLAKEDKLLAAGPFEGGGGIFIMNTTSTEQARTWINTDPAISAGRYHIEVLPWTPRTGSVCQVNEKAEMVYYTFVRYNSNITKFNVQQAPLLFNRHDDYMKEIAKTGNVISEGYFDNSDGGTMIMKGDVGREVIMADPAVKNGILQPEIKTIWIGKGSFCESSD